MKVSLSQIKSWFKKGMYPTESQFANTFDSFWHKDDTLPLSAIQNLMQILNDKAFTNHTHQLNDITDLSDFEQDISNQLANKANAEHEHQQYLTDHQDISGKQDKIDEALLTTEKSVVGAINGIHTSFQQHLNEYQSLGESFLTVEQTVHEHVTVHFPTLQQEVENLKEKGAGAPIDISLVVSTTYSELKQLRDSSALSPGTWYRITDYETTVYNNANARSAGHPFDVLVMATDVNQLSEDAKAVHSVRDTEGYFAHANLAAWKLKYSLDNDTAKFVWASDGGEKYTVTLPEIGLLELTPVSTNDTTYEGCPYKFTSTFSGMQLSIYLAHLELQEGEEFIHNVLVIEGMGQEMEDQFPVTSIVHENQAPGKGVIWEMEDEYNNLCSYDFKNIQFKRWLIISEKESPSEEECCFYGKYVGNLIEELPALPEGYYINPEDSKYLYRFSVIAADGSVEDNSLGIDLTSAGMGIYHLCTENRARPNMNTSSFGLDLNDDVFVATCNSVDDMMNLIQIGNVFGTMCKGNTFVNMTVENTFGNECWFNTFGNSCRYNSFGNNCYRNSFGNYCYYNSFGNYCYYNSFGNNCGSNSFGNDCDNNSFGNNCYRNSFGNGCNNNDILDNVRYITVFEGVQYVSIGSASGYVQYAQVLNGTSGSDSSSKLKIDFAVGKNYTQVAGKNSSGELKIWVPADIVA